MLKIFKRDLFLCAAITVFVMFCALAWGGPFIGNTLHAGAVYAKTHHQPTVFQGAVLRDGDQVVLRDNSGVLFHLADLQSPENYIGKTVVITGHLEATSRTIRIDHIQPS